ncbi:hypothetical protein K1719_016615 [Acacia pycnantha]|nr:hypothetical protein K1719_016615 [Acacia pycnantha]
MEERKDRISEERWSWTKKYSIEHPYMLVPRVIWRNMIVCRCHSESAHEVKGDGHIVLVNLTTDELKRFAFHKYDLGFHVLNYVESLVPVDKIQIEDL